MVGATIDSGAFRNPNRDLYVNLLGTKKQNDLQAKPEFAYPREDWWWTGKRPVHGECPGVGEDGIITSLPLPNITASGSRQDVLDYFDNTWALTEVLFSGIIGEDTFIRTPWHQLRHPMMFYYGHVAVVYVNKLRVAGFITEGVDEYLEQIMETGVDEMSWDDLSKNEMEWPPLRDVTEYRRKVYNLVRKIIQEGDISFPIKMEDPSWSIVMGFEHERIHLETSSVLIRELPAYLVTRPKEFPAPHPSCDEAADRTVNNEWVKVEGGKVELGKPHDFPSFGWDNEYGTRTVEVEGFEATKNLITNGEFLEFVKAGGYNDKNCWTEAGWQWRRFRNVLFPVFWVPNGPVGLNQYKLRAVFDIINLPLSWPVDVNSHEAAAYCNWRASLDSSPHPYRLISEVEHHLIRDSSTKDMSKGDKRDFLLAYSGAQMWDGSQKDNKYNTNLAFGSSTPVDALAPSDKGFRDTFGNVWQWTADDFNMLDGFEVHPLYLDFSSPCFDGLHTIILGGSFISTGDEASIFSRFHFRPHFSQHAGFRMATGPSNPATILPKQGTNGASVAQKDASSSDSDMDVMMLAHYGSRLEVLQWENGPSTALSFPTRIADHLQTSASSMGVPLKRALDMGCAVGRSSFHLAMGYDQVVGVDLSKSFIDAATELKCEGQCMYKRKDALGQTTEIVSSIDNVVDRTRVEFHVDDACSVSPEIYGTFDGILVSCLLEYVHSPKDVLANLSNMVTSGGLIVIATSNVWSEAHTPRNNWLSTTDETSLEGIAASLGPEFSMKSRGDMANLNRVNTRKFEWIMLEVSVWQKA